MKKESAREVYTAEILKAISPVFDKTIDTGYFAQGAVGIYRYKDGMAYEVQVRPIDASEHSWLSDPYTQKKDRSPEPQLEEDLEASGNSWYKKAQISDGGQHE